MLEVAIFILLRPYFPPKRSILEDTVYYFERDVGRFGHV